MYVCIVERKPLWRRCKYDVHPQLWIGVRNSYLPNPKIKLVRSWTLPLASLNMVVAGRPKNLSGLNSSGSSNSSVLVCNARMLPTIVVPFSMMLPRQTTIRSCEQNEITWPEFVYHCTYYLDQQHGEDQSKMWV